MAAILVVDDEKNMCSVLKILLERDGHVVRTARTGMQALEYLGADSRVDLIISDLRMPEMDGIELLRRLQRDGRDIPLIVLTAYGSIEAAVEAMKRGAADFITKPFNNDVIRHIVRRTLERVGEAEHDLSVERESPDWKVIHSSPAMQEVMGTVRKVARVQTSVLITGESGVGKEIVAREIHRLGGLSSGTREKPRPFASISCPSVPESLMASELFGYQKGAFSGASKGYEGKLCLAAGGTLLLDEIGDLPLEVQPRLLRFLEDRTFQRLGANTLVRVEARILCATNRNLPDMVRAGSFREDLYYRINTITIRVPPLRERREDIAPLTDHFVARFSKATGKIVRRVSARVMGSFMAYPWPGNVRELRNVIERAVVLANSSSIDAADVPEEILGASPAGEAPPAAKPANRLEESEIALLREVLDRNSWNVTAAARELGVSRNTLRYRMDKYSLHKRLNDD